MMHRGIHWTSAAVMRPCLFHSALYPPPWTRLKVVSLTDRKYGKMKEFVQAKDSASIIKKGSFMGYVLNPMSQWIRKPFRYHLKQYRSFIFRWTEASIVYYWGWIHHILQINAIYGEFTYVCAIWEGGLRLPVLFSRRPWPVGKGCRYMQCSMSQYSKS